jgi:hypothetical protein
LAVAASESVHHDGVLVVGVGRCAVVGSSSAGTGAATMGEQERSGHSKQIWGCGLEVTATKPERPVGGSGPEWEPKILGRAFADGLGLVFVC